MSWAFLMMQALSSPPPPQRIDLMPVVPQRDCRATGPDEIVVCGDAPGERHRLKPVDPTRYAEQTEAETGLIGDVRVAAEAEQAEIAPGVISKRVMVRLKLPI